MANDLARRVTDTYSTILHSKRLCLQWTLRCLAERPSDELVLRATRLASDIERAELKRVQIRIKHGDAHDPEFWVDAYRLLIQQGETLAGQLRGRRPEAVDLALIDGQLALWRRRLRDWMVAASA